MFIDLLNEYITCKRKKGHETKVPISDKASIYVNIYHQSDCCSYLYSSLQECFESVSEDFCFIYIVQFFIRVSVGQKLNLGFSQPNNLWYIYILEFPHAVINNNFKDSSCY